MPKHTKRGTSHIPKPRKAVKPKKVKKAKGRK